ncbi:unnamed protein product [Blepharisma stoltei]|uniref:Uncharacterized protein n=1 Tax=Blepharisma stoltei TaxID=1481888 RepID=A0AAU9IB60_9CILI|nr:unnamed protein product [Blepharisma stoltei]
MARNAPSTWSHYTFSTPFFSDFFAFGVYSAQGLWIFDAYIEGYGEGNVDFWIIWIENLKLIDEFFDKATTDDIDKYSQSVIDDQMVIIEAALFIFIAFSFVAYFGFSLLFFRNEKKYLQKIYSIQQIMPNNYL